MKHEFRLADIGEGLEEAEIVSWLVRVGDRVERDQPLVEVMTDKSNAELPAPSAGVVSVLGGDVGDILEVGELIAVIDDGAISDVPSGRDEPEDAVGPETVGPAPVEPEPAEPAPVEPVRATHDGSGANGAAPGSTASIGRPKASPKTRRVAVERGIDLATVLGTGPGGRILLSDLDLDQDPATGVAAEPATPAFAALAAPAATPPRATPASTPPTPPLSPTPSPTAAHASTAASAAEAGTVPLRGIRRAVATNMTQSWTDIPHIHSFDQIDAEPLLDLRARLRATGRPEYEHLTPVAFFVAAVAQALRKFPQANTSIDMEAETVTTHAHVNIGVAVAAPQGLVVPVLGNADQLDFADLAPALAALITQARTGQLDRSYFQGGTATITNFGSLGGEQATPLIRPPEAMIVGFGSMKQRPFVVGGEVVARTTMHIVTGADHRLLDGDVVTAVLTDICASLTDPLRLVL